MSAFNLLLTSAAATLIASCQSVPTTAPLNFAEISCEALPDAVFPPEGLRIHNHNNYTRGHYKDRIAEFRTNPLQCGQIVMLGDSLTEQNDWSQTVQSDNAIRNRGIAGDTSDGLRQRLDETIASKPAIVFIMIGTNDLWTSNTPKQTVDNIVGMVNRISQHNPDTTIIIQTVLPVSSEPELNRQVRDINYRLKSSTSLGRTKFLDVHNAMRDGDGNLSSAFTTDGVHLNKEGYAVWSAMISELLIDLEESTVTP